MDSRGVARPEYRVVETVVRSAVVRALLVADCLCDGRLGEVFHPVVLGEDDLGDGLHPVADRVVVIGEMSGEQVGISG